jgi:hypothetical protein
MIWFLQAVQDNNKERPKFNIRHPASREKRARSGWRSFDKRPDTVIRE